MKRRFKRFKRRLRAYCLACDKAAPSGPPELVLAWLKSAPLPGRAHRQMRPRLGQGRLVPGLQTESPPCRASCAPTLRSRPVERGRVMCRPTLWPECRSPLGYRAGTCDTCHAHHQICIGPAIPCLGRVLSGNQRGEDPVRSGASSGDDGRRGTAGDAELPTSHTSTSSRALLD
jgi:hypothetical protein